MAKLRLCAAPELPRKRQPPSCALRIDEAGGGKNPSRLPSERSIGVRRPASDPHLWIVRELSLVVVGIGSALAGLLILAT